MTFMKMIPVHILLAIMVLASSAFFFIRKYKKNKIRRSVLADSQINPKEVATNIKNGIANGRQLYKKMITAVHPDRFSDDEEKRRLATEISSRITENKRNYTELLKLKAEIEILFGITLN